MSSSFHNAHANTYERMGSNATVNIAKHFLPDLSNFSPITPSSYILDNASGTGIVTQLIKAQHPYARIKGCDLAPSVIEVFKSKIKEKGWENVETDILDVRDLKTLEDDTFTHVITNFGFSPTPDDHSGPAKAAAEMYRVLQPGGVAVVTTWSERNFDEAIQNAARVVRSDEKPFSWGIHEDWNHGWWLMKHLEEAGFGNKVQVKSAVGRIEAPSLEELVSNMMLFKDMFYKGYSREELVRVEKALGEEIRRLPAFEQTDRDVGIKMVAWIGYAWK